ncbi:MAG TPA: class I SAM-dependent methyltransferase [Verrucomicrobiae bacterium]
MKVQRVHEPATIARLRLRITAAAESTVRSGHPWVFAESVERQNRAGESGELSVVYDRRDRFLAIGLFDPDSPIRLRVLHTGKPVTIDESWWVARLKAAVERRRSLFDAQTTGFRLINGESDGWPGLVLDRYDQTLVMKLYTTAWLARLDEIAALVQREIQPGRIVLRLSRNIQKVAIDRFARQDGTVLRGGPLQGPIIFRETGLRFEADVLKGQKTGFFLDQRENRRRVGALARGRDVLNAFSFTGGFSLYAARGGARSVTDLDISAHALGAAERNFTLNKTSPAIASCPHECIQTDVFEWLAGNAERNFGLIILDPPSLAKRASEKAGAVRAYGKLVTTALNHLLPGGILVACSCSAHVTAEEFFGAVQKAGAGSGRKLREIETTFHAPDHPATFKEAKYLKAIYLRA